MKRLDITGQKFNRLTAIERIGTVEKSGQLKSIWLFRCDCGTNKELQIGSVKYGAIKSCGCSVENSKVSRLTHGKIKSKEYAAWNGIKNRCLNENSKSFPQYGGRGIKVCDRWLESFENFYADMGDKPSPHHSLDRKDNNGNYTPENCRWATKTEQALNRRSNHLIDIDGVKKPLSIWCKELGLNYKAAHHQIKTRGKSPKEVLGL